MRPRRTEPAILQDIQKAERDYELDSSTLNYDRLVKLVKELADHNEYCLGLLSNPKAGNAWDV